MRKSFIDGVRPALLFYYKCIKPKIPETQVAVFVEKLTNERETVLDYEHDRQDTYGDDTTGYVTPLSGDSGGPYWTYDRLNANDVRSVLIAIHISGEDSTDISSDKYAQCRIKSTKITDDILRWVKDKSGISLG